MGALIAVKFVGRGRTEAEVRANWTLVKRTILPEVLPQTELRLQFIACVVKPSPRAWYSRPLSPRRAAPDPRSLSHGTLAPSPRLLVYVLKGWEGSPWWY